MFHQNQSDIEVSDSQAPIVIGAGPAGLTAAYQLTKEGITPIVLEKGEMVGGLARTESYKGYYFDMGGHRFFTKSAEVDEMWHEVLAEQFLRRPRLSRIYYKNKFFNYPLKPLNALLGLGFVESVLILFSYVRWQLFPYKVEETFEQWVTNRFGRRLFMTFFKTYTEKVWGISCSELKAEWAAQRIKDLSLRTVILSMFRKPGTKIKTLIEQFDYPRLGPGMMWQAVSSCIEERGGEVQLNAGVNSIRRTGNRINDVIVGENGATRVVSGTDFISSMPLTEFVRKLDPPAPATVLEAADQLKYRDFLTVCLIIRKKRLFDDNWIYIHDPTVKVGRIQNYKNWSPEMVPDPSMTGLGLEYFCNEGDELWTMTDEELIKLGREEVDRLGLASSDDVEDGCVFRVEKSYPVYDADYRNHLSVLRTFVEEFENFQTIGRNGLHRYNNQDHAMLTGMKAVANMVNGERNDLWRINADQEYHEEVRSDDSDKTDPPNEDADTKVVTESEEQEQLELAFAKVDRMALGLSLGISLSVGLFLATIVLLVQDGLVEGPNLNLLGHFLPGYSVSIWGSFLGLGYGFLCGLIMGWTIGLLRNACMLLFLALVQRHVEYETVRRVLEYF